LLNFLLIVALILVVIFYERRWRRARRIILELKESVETDQRFLLDADWNLASRMGLDQLLRTIQAMMDERSQVRAQSDSQVEQIEITFRNMREGALLIDSENRIAVSNLSADRLLNEGKSLA
jgi:signal transduction histidine kinase